MVLIVVVCAASGLIVSEAKTGITFLRTKGIPEATGVFSGPDVQPNERGRPAHTQGVVHLLEVHPRTVRPTERSPRAQNPNAKGRGTRDNAVRLRHVEPARAQLWHAAPSLPQFPDSLYWLAKTQSRRPSDSLSGHFHDDGKREHRVSEAIMSRRYIRFAGFMVRMEDTRLPKCVMFVELVGGAVRVGGQGKEWMGCLLDDLRAFDVNSDHWTTAAQDERGWPKIAEQGGAERFMAKCIAAEKNKDGLRHAVMIGGCAW